MFQPGTLIVYGTTGVCRVEEITKPEDMGPDRGRQYYLLKPLHQDGVIYTPVDNKKVAMRPVISAKQAEALIDMIPTIPAEAYHGTTLQSLSQHYQTAMQSNDFRALIELMKSIRAKQRQAESQNRRLGMVDERFMKQAERLLYGELSVALGIGFDEVLPYIIHRLDAMEAPES